jgi:broad specificity phosphatase PhoE
METNQYWSCKCQATKIQGKQKIQIIAMRHGESEHNVKGVVNGDPSKQFHITLKGLNQAQELAQQLKERRDIVAIIASEMQRTQETAKPLADLLGLPVEVDSRLNDIFPGGLEGIPILEFRKITNNIKVSVQGSETNEGVAKRLKSFLDDLIKCHPGETVVIVSSEIILHTLEQISKGQPADEDIGEHLKNGIFYEFMVQSPIYCQSCGERCKI